MLVLLIPAGLLLLVDFYFFQIVKTLLVDSSSKMQLFIYVIYWLMNISLVILTLVGSNRSYLPNHYRYYIFTTLLLFLVPKLIGCVVLLIEDLSNLTAYLINVFQADSTSSHSRRKFVSQIGLITASIPFATMLYGMARTGFRFKVRTQKVFYEDLPMGFDGLRIAQISDLHSGSFITNEMFERAIGKINDLDVDLAFFTGDLVNNEAPEAERFIKTFSKLRAKLGVYSVLGNHDYGDYSRWPSKEAKDDNLNRLKAVHSQSGWKLLLNENDVLQRGEDKLAIVGVENWGASKHFPKYGDLDRATNSADTVPFKILLSHDPSHWDAQILKHTEKFQLTLSGHTHGAQFGIEIPGFKWSPVQYVYKQWAGLYDNGDGQKLYVNRGLGFIGFMGRIGISPEITVLELRSKKKA